jgi:excisionase family DNA binding protein
LAPFTLSFADRLLTAREVAARLRVSTRTVYALCEQGKLAHFRIMNAIRVEPAALVAFVAAQGLMR